nr:hypothetical protein [Tanacetum cinerariifolium]
MAYSMSDKLRIELDVVQKGLDLSLTDSYLREEENVYLKAFNEAKLDEERFLKQKAKIDWLEVGDSNSSYFHKSIKCRNQRSRIEVVVNSDNIEVSGSHVSEVFVSYYKHFLGTSMECNELNVEGLFSKSISATTSSNMVRGITNDEIKVAMFDIGDDKGSGPDWYTFSFFINGWSVVGHDVCNAIRDFISNGCILNEINHTFLALISKGNKEVVSDNQAAFVSGRQISDILITQELMHSYHRNHGPPRCAFKVDIQKAYDTVDWRFLEAILVRFRFHCTMVKWIMACVTSTSFSLNINGNIHGFFKGKRGLRQGDPFSPYLFTMVMENLTLILKRQVRMSDSFRFYKHCEELKIINVCFSDDLFIFARGELALARVILESLDEFK